VGEEELFSRTTVKARYDDVVYDSRGCYARLDDLERVWIVDVARNRVRITALGVIRTGRSIMRNVIVRSTSDNQCGHRDQR
jgi:hypothetical protein